jgi:hypothetical protein
VEEAVPQPAGIKVKKIIEKINEKKLRSPYQTRLRKKIAVNAIDFRKSLARKHKKKDNWMEL